MVKEMMVKEAVGVVGGGCSYPLVTGIGWSQTYKVRTSGNLNVNVSGSLTGGSISSNNGNVSGGVNGGLSVTLTNPPSISITPISADQAAREAYRAGERETDC